MLHNTAYIGTVYDDKMQRLPGKSNPDKKTRHRHVPREEWIAVAVPSIVDAATFEAAQARLAHNKKRSRRNRKHEYLFVNGRLRCGQCGGAMTGVTKDDRQYYGCHRRPFHDPVTRHTKRAIRAADIEPVVWEAVERALNDPTVITAELERRRLCAGTQQTDLDRERQHYTRQLAQCAKDLKRWEAAYLGEAIDLDDFKSKKAEVDVRRASAEQELTRLGAEQRLIEQAELETAAITDYCARARTGLQRATMEKKRLTLEALAVKVVWHPEKPAQIQELTASIPLHVVTSACL